MSLIKTMNALSEPNRLKILKLLKERDLSVSEISEGLDIGLATLSHHLDTLKQSGLVSGRRQGQKIIYSLNLSVMEEVMEQIIKFFSINKKGK